MIKYFYLDESPINPGYFVIKSDIEKMHFNAGFCGSFNLLPARVMNVSYANWLRLLRDSFGANIVGKNTKYPVAYLKPSNELTALLKLLNTRMKYCMYDYDHPYEIIKSGKELVKEYYVKEKEEN